MKLKRKKRLLLSLSGLLVLLLTNCEKDYEESTTNYNLTTSRFDIRVLDSEQILSNAKVMDELQKIAGQTKAQATGTGTPIGTSRILYNSTYGFSVNTAYVKYVEDTTTGKHSYNFPLTRDSLVTSHLENLLLSSRSDGSYDAYIVEYGFSKYEYNAVSQTTLNNTTTRYYPIDFDTSVFNSGELNKMVLEYSCVEIWSLEVVPAHQGDNTGGELYTEEWVLVSNECTWNYYDDGTDGGSGSTTTTTGVETSGGVGGSGSGGSTGGTTGDNSDTGDSCKGCSDGAIISIPAVESAVELITPCKKILDQLNNSDFKEKEHIVNSSSAFNADHEIGFSQNSDNSFNELTADGGHALDIPINSNMIGYIHSHINRYEVPDSNGDGIPEEVKPIKMPSPGDVIKFLILLQNADNNGIPLSDVYGSMYSAVNDYTLKFTGDIQDVLANINNLRTLKNNKTLDKKYMEYFKKYKLNREKAFLKFLKNEIGIEGIRLFKINGKTVKEKFLNENGGVSSQDC
ncbi:hypothetical protein NHF50_07480 [Flavobacterium sp. NRK F10]|nr:hypothetical protein [Flavobacterium sp. NRK F10]MCO6174885.1 hypothetical protein [Flavobacterium sp. NRK F10]